MGKLRVISLFSGIGAFEKALTKQGIEHEVLGFSEIDKYAIESYCAIHNESKDKCLGDVSQVNLDRFKGLVDLVVGGSPCQDFSTAGKKQGSTYTCKACEGSFNPLLVHHMERDKCPSCGSGELDKTRSSLLIEYMRVIRELNPKYFVYENVKNIAGKQFKEGFDSFQKELVEYGYSVSYKVLNSKDFGIPQRRERVFLVGVRKDVGVEYEFKEGIYEVRALDSLLEERVPEKYYIEKGRANELIEREKDGVRGTYPDVSEGAVMSCALGSREHRSGGWRSTSNTLRARDYKDPNVVAIPTKDSYQIRKVVPLEYWRLMGFTDLDFQKAKEAMEKEFYGGKERASSQLYKQAGNSIVVDVLAGIFKELMEQTSQVEKEKAIEGVITCAY